MRQLTATGFWPLYRFDPRRANEGKLPLALDSRPPSDALAETLLNEQRFRRLNAQQPEVAEQLWKDAAADLQKRYDFWPNWQVKQKRAVPSNTFISVFARNQKSPNSCSGLSIYSLAN